MLQLESLRGLNERLQVDTSEERPVYLLAAQNGSYIRLSPSAYGLLKLCAQGASFEAAAEVLGRQNGTRVSPQEVQASYENVVQRISAIDGRGPKKPGGFWFRLPLLSGALVARVAPALSVAFQPVAAAGLLACILAAVLFHVAQGFPSDWGPSSFWWAYVLLLISAFVHEFGHASACARYGARPSEIGFTLYLCYPAFFSDVSSAWELKRWQRVVVDLGGAYFQLLVGALYAAAYALTGWEPLSVAFLFIAGSCLFSLNPIFKFDGYWVLADALGVTNLAEQPARILRHVGMRLLGRPGRDLPWPAAVTAALALYTALSIGVWGYFCWWLLAALAEGRLQGYAVLALLAAGPLFAGLRSLFRRWRARNPSSRTEALSTSGTLRA